MQTLQKSIMKQLSSIISGLAGSVALTILHELLKKNVSAAPRMDKLGEQSLSKIFSATGSEIPPADDLYKLTLGGDIVGNAAYYSMVGIKPKYSLVLVQLSDLQQVSAPLNFRAKWD